MPATVSWKLYKSELQNPTPPSKRAYRPTDRLEVTGFWRLEQAKTKVDWPVAIWTSEGKEEVGSILQIGRKIYNTEEHADVWDDFINGRWLSCVAVTEAEWHRAQKEGVWPDGKPAREMTTDEKLGVDIAPGDNQAPLHELLADQIKALVDRGMEMRKGGIKTKEQADAATTLLDKLRALLQRAEQERVKEKEPHLQASREVDGKWGGIRQPGLDLGKQLAADRDGWLREEQRRIDEQVRQENERRRLEAEEAARKEAARQQAIRDAAAQEQAAQAEAMGMEAPEVDEEPEPIEVAPVQFEEVKAPKVVAGSAYGKNVSAKKLKKTIVDFKAFSSHLLKTDDEDFKDYLQKRAERAVRAKVTLPGVTVEEV